MNEDVLLTSVESGIILSALQDMRTRILKNIGEGYQNNIDQGCDPNPKREEEDRQAIRFFDDHVASIRKKLG
jgi:hypothetical protein